MVELVRSQTSLTETAFSRGTTITSKFERGLRRVSFTIKPLACKPSILASSAEKKRSAGAPSSIWRAKRLEAAKLKAILSPVLCSYVVAISLKLSVRLEAAKTVNSAAAQRSDPKSITARKVHQRDAR